MTTTDNSRADALTDEQIDAIAPEFLIIGDCDTEHDSIDWRGFARAILAKQSTLRTIELPAAPVRPDYDADAVRFGECDHCNKRSHIRPHDGAMICGSCADADYLTAWIDYAEQLRAILAASPVEQHEAAPAACPQCGGSITTWKCTCEPMWEGYMRAFAPSAPLEGTGNGAAFERALSELVDKIAPGIDSGDLLSDARIASEKLDRALPAVSRGTRDALMAVAARYRGNHSNKIADEIEALLSPAPRTEVAGAVPGWAQGVEAVAKMLDKKGADYVDEFGYVEHDTGALSFGQGAHADVKRDYHSSLVELAEEVRAMAAPPSADAAAAPADERAAFVKLMGYDRPEMEGVALFIWNSQRAAWLEALDFAHAAASQPAAGQEAVAWETTHPAVCTPLTKEPLIAADWREKGWHVVPLYTAPPAQVATRQGLTEQAIADAVAKWFPDRAYQAPFFARELLKGGEHE
ncbi:hypothetical protein [Burkholderia vietnamiensis]|uniref:hypothetical protein n=1 Tax=Burkholderia vietnamiensis TaxID=60552 RepID=UPI001CF45930|nr:hypothetical protein [Burkholderia vietnamiensis]MCA7985203.1 hypothetical protein [Burkholderia vietnamiensis]